METIVRVTRLAVGYRAALAHLSVLIDGETVGRLRRGESRAFSVRPGIHRVQVRIDWKSSGEWTVELKNGETGHFLCHPATGIGRIFGPNDEYLVLVPADE